MAVFAELYGIEKTVSVRSATKLTDVYGTRKITLLAAAIHRS